MNCGILQLPWVTGGAASTQYSGQFIFKLNDLPVYVSEQLSYEFVRVNKFVMHFMPRYNMATLPTSADGNTGALQQYFGQTFITAMDEVPLLGATSGLITASQTWVSQSDEDAGVNEMEAYRNETITPDYIRGIKGSKETELYKAHKIMFTPVYYIAAVDFTNTGTEAQVVEYEQRKRRWLPTNITAQSTGGGGDTPTLLAGPTFHGPIYSFTQLASASPTNPTQVYDVKVDYSVSFKRYKGA